MRKLAILMGLLLILAVGVLPAAAITWDNWILSTPTWGRW